MKRETAFNILTANRKKASAAREASKAFSVHFVNKNGSVRKAAVEIFGHFDSFEKADVRRVELEKLNPGKKVVVIEK